MKPDKFLLYIDILGFSDMVKKSPKHVKLLYKIIDKLHCHKDRNFGTIVFSDTILIYTLPDLLHRKWIETEVMYLIECAQELMHKTIGFPIQFRAVLTKGEFEHVKMENFDRYYGKALILAYQNEKKLKYCGLMIDKKCQEYNKIFCTATLPDNNDYLYVFLNQSIRSFEEGYVAVDYIEETEEQWGLAKDSLYLKALWQGTQKTEPSIRMKYENTYNLFKKKFPNTIKKLEVVDFSPIAFSKKVAWEEPLSKAGEGFWGRKVEVPDNKVLDDIFSKAIEAGEKAAEGKKIELLKGEEYKNQMLGLCGGASITFGIDGRSKFARKFKEYCEAHKKVCYWFEDSEVNLGFHVHSHQEHDIDKAAHEAILVVLKEGFPGIDFDLDCYYS